MPPSQPAVTSIRSPASRDFIIALICLATVLVLFFARSFAANDTLFSNDGPLGAIASEKYFMPGGFLGVWENLNWFGIEGISAAPNLTVLLACITSPVAFSKFYGPLTLLLLGAGAWLLFRQFRFNNWVCLLGGIAAMLNVNVFSNVCWGLATRALALACVFFALAALVSGHFRRPILKAILGGMAVGMAVMEGFDVGAIYSLYVAAFGLFLVLMEDGSSMANKVTKGVLRVSVVAVFAAFVAAYTLSTLISTQIKGIAGTQQDEKSKLERWDFATQWSMPKAEALRVLIPGVFGYRMDTPDGGNYWGTTGRQPGYEQHHQGFARHSGSGEYAGVLVVLVAAWAFAQSLRRRDSLFSGFEQRIIWFWAGTAFISLLLAFGRHAPFYRIVYALPYFSTIRNPMKFMHPFHLALGILFAFGLQALSRRYLDEARETGRSLIAQFKQWWAASQGFEKKWAVGSLVALVAAALGWLLYSATRNELVSYLDKDGFGGDLGGKIARFSYGEVGLFVLVLALAVGLFLCILSGGLAGRRAKWAWLAMGLFLVVDLGRADKRYLVYYNYQEKLASNAVLDILRDRPYEHRVTMPPLQLPPQMGVLSAVYSEWLQNSIQYYNIQSLDIIQMRSRPEDMVAYENALRGVPARLWELSNTRFLLTAAQAVDVLNQQLDPMQHRFRVHTSFDFAPKPGLASATRLEDLDVVLRTNAPYALIEFTGALPRAKLYSNWQVSTNDQATLQTLVNPAFNPAQTVLISDTVPAPKPEEARQNAGEVAITAYAPKHLRLEASAAVPAVLLLNDRFSPNWKVTVDGKPETLLRCNHIVRGVKLPAGRHVVEFRFQPPVRILWVSVAGLGLGLLAGLFLLFTSGRSTAATIKPVQAQ